MNKLAVVTVTYNAEENLSFFLPSLEENSECVEHVFFVDNNSSDETCSKLQSWKTSIRHTITKHAKNYGYAYAVNVGIQQARDMGYEYILVTNNDIIFHQGCFAQLLNDRESTGAHVVGVPASTNPTLLGLGCTLDRSSRMPATPPTREREGLPLAIEQDPTPSVDFVHGGTILFTKKFFDALGLYDTNLFFGGDELDFMYRVYAYNTAHAEKILCVASLRSTMLCDNLSKHNNKHKLIKARGMLQGNVRVLLKHRYTPTDLGLYKAQWNMIEALAKGSILRYGVLCLFTLRALILEGYHFYTQLLRKNNTH